MICGVLHIIKDQFRPHILVPFVTFSLCTRPTTKHYQSPTRKQDHNELHDQALIKSCKKRVQFHSMVSQVFFLEIQSTIKHMCPHITTSDAQLKSHNLTIRDRCCYFFHSLTEDRALFGKMLAQVSRLCTELCAFICRF